MGVGSPSTHRGDSEEQGCYTREEPLCHNKHSTFCTGFPRFEGVSIKKLMGPTLHDELAGPLNLSQDIGASGGAAVGGGPRV